MEITLQQPGPDRRARGGTILPASASTSPSMPSSRGTGMPQMSASSTPTTRPRRARATARLTVIDDLPTPPLPDAIGEHLALAGMSVAGARSWAFSAARAMTASPLGGIHDPGADLDGRDAGERLHAGAHVSARSGRAAGRRRR